MSEGLKRLNDAQKSVTANPPYDVTPPFTLPPSMVTTAFDLPGYKIVRNLGIVRGITVRSRSIIGAIGAGLQTIVGGNITIYTKLCEQARTEAYDILVQHAAQIGANAIIGMRYDANEVMQGVTEVLAYGTAVYVEQADQSASVYS